MSFYARIFASTADARGTTTSTSYATARAATTATTTTETSTPMGQAFSSPNYTITQYFGVFDTSAIPAGAYAAELSFVNSVTATTADTYEVREVSSVANMIAGDNLAAQTLFGSGLNVLATSQRWSIPMADISAMSRSSSCKLLVHSQKQRTATAPTTNAAPTVSTGDTGGTSKPFLNILGSAWRLVGVSSVVEATATPLILTEPAGVADGDLLVACISSRSTATTAPTATGWTAVNSQNNNNILSTGSALASGAMLYQVRSGAPTLSFTLPAGISIAQGQIVAYRGGGALDVSTATTTAVSTLNVSVTGLTTTQDDDLLVAMCAGGQEAAWTVFGATSPPSDTSAGSAPDTNTSPTSVWIRRSNTATTTGVDTSIAVFDAIMATAGATGNLTATASVAAGHVVVAGAFKIAVSAGPIAATFNVTLDPVTTVINGNLVSTGIRQYSIGSLLGAVYVSETGANSYALPTVYVSESYVPAAGGPTSATFNVTIGPVTLSVNGDLLVQGSLGQTLDAVTLASSGYHITATGTLSQTIDPVIVTTNGDLLVQGQLSKLIDPVTVTMTSQVLVQGSLSRTIDPVTLTTNGDLLVQGNVSATLDAVTLSANGSSVAVINSTLSITLSPMAVSASGYHITASGTFGVTIDPVTVTTNGDLLVQGLLSRLVDPVTLTANGVLSVPGVITGTLGVTLDPVTLSAAGSVALSSCAWDLGAGTWDTAAATWDTICIPVAPGSGQPDGDGGRAGAVRRKRAKIFYIITEAAKKVVERPGPLRKKRKKLAKIIAEEILPEAGGLLAADKLLLELMIRRQLEQIPLTQMHTQGWYQLQDQLLEVITDAEQTAQRLRFESEEEDDLLLLLTS